MSEVRKKFDRNLYEKADREAKEAMVSWLKEHDHTNIDTNETTYFDIVSTVGPELPRHLYEVEVKYSWKSDEWPDSWKELRIPHRKKRNKKNGSHTCFREWVNDPAHDLPSTASINHSCLLYFRMDFSNKGGH